MPPDQPAPGPGDPPRSRWPDEVWLDDWLAASRRRWRLWHGVRSVMIGAGVALLTRAALAPLASTAIVMAIAAGVLSTLVALMVAPGLRDLRPIVRATEAANPGLRNALFAWQEGRVGLPAVIAARLAAHARRTLTTSAPPPPVSRQRWALATVVLAVGFLASLAAPQRSPAVSRGTSASTDTPGTASADRPLRWHVLVTPPVYTRRRPQHIERPSRVDVLAGSRVDVAFANWPEGAVALLGGTPLALVAARETLAVQLTATASDVLLMQDRDGAVLGTLTLVVTPDAPPVVRITKPAADLRRAAATGTVSLQIAARDDLGLRDLRLRFTKVSGSGESFTFEDGEWPVQVRQTTATDWNGTHTLDLAALGLGPGDSVVYHAVAHDARTGPEGAAESERFLIEIARPGAAASGDFSLPEPEERFALSQRMVIQLTERLIERRPRMSSEEFRQEAQALAIAQRRVRAEFVFMLGGEVEDEVDEAAHSHEVEAGRLDNRGQGDLTEAVRQMSQAETRLTAVDVREALTYEYRALAALQAAFGKARYFMRTLPAPVQIDVGRRLQGDRGAAASSRWRTTPLPDASRAAALDLLGRLEGRGTPVASVLPELVALDRADAAWVSQVQRAATDEGASGVTRLLRARLLPGSTTWMAMPLTRSTAEAAMATAVGAGPR